MSLGLVGNLHLWRGPPPYSETGVDLIWGQHEFVCVTCLGRANSVPAGEVHLRLKGLAEPVLRLARGIVFFGFPPFSGSRSLTVWIGWGFERLILEGQNTTTPYHQSKQTNWREDET